MMKNGSLILDEKRIRGLYNILSRRYGPQGWWPIRSRRINAGADISYTIGFNSGGYHPGIEHNPDSISRLEIAIGAVLTQNTNWHNASAALDTLINEDMLSIKRILSTSNEALAELIRPSGYHNQKALKLKAIADLFKNTEGIPERSKLLSVWGIGPETADVILLYAFGVPVFVVDAYTRRIFSRFTGLDIIEHVSYEELQSSVQEVFSRDVDLLREYHALIDLHAKKYCKKIPNCSACPLGRACKKRKCLQNH